MVGQDDTVNFLRESKDYMTVVQISNALSISKQSIQRHIMKMKEFDEELLDIKMRKNNKGRMVEVYKVKC